MTQPETVTLPRATVDETRALIEKMRECLKICVREVGLADVDGDYDVDAEIMANKFITAADEWLKANP